MNNKNEEYIFSSLEHPSVYNYANKLLQEGRKVKFISTNSNGLVNEEELINEINSNTKFVSIINVSNETGIINNVNDLALKFYRENLEKSDEAKTFLASKGFRSDVIAKYQLGYADINDSFAEKFQNVFAEKYLITNPSTRIGTGLLLKKDGHYSDLFKNCIIIPIFNQAGKVVVNITVDEKKTQDLLK